MNTNIIDQIAAKLAVPVEHVWGLLIQQAFYYGMSELITHGLLILLWIGVYIVYRKKIIPRFIKDEEYVFAADLLVTVVWCFVFLLMICAVDYYMIFTAFTNPEFWALKQIIK